MSQIKPKDFYMELSLQQHSQCCLRMEFGKGRVYVNFISSLLFLIDLKLKGKNIK